MTKPYPWYYAVNDRPLMVTKLPDGTEEMFVFDFVTGNLSVDRSYYAHITPGSGKDVDQLTPEQFFQLIVARRVDLVHMWCERMCKLSAASARELEALIGMPAQPLPMSARAVTIQGDEHQPASITLELPDEVMRRSDLETRFGTGTVFPRPHDDLMHGFAYEVKVTGAPHGCMVLASTMPDRPDPDAYVKTLTLRLERNRGRV